MSNTSASSQPSQFLSLSCIFDVFSCRAEQIDSEQNFAILCSSSTILSFPQSVLSASSQLHHSSLSSLLFPRSKMQYNQHYILYFKYNTIWFANLQGLQILIYTNAIQPYQKSTVDPMIFLKFSQGKNLCLVYRLSKKNHPQRTVNMSCENGFQKCTFCFKKLSKHCGWLQNINL